ncbi:hypothetical protein [Brevibacillus borstelensis]|uniref:hypothetical protein n=1 Tax=Brevibacillus borstelensis TaxID=45462 RepID=UPI0030C1CA85
MIEKYGTQMDEQEFADFKKIYDERVKQADQYVQSRKEFTDAGIQSYADFLKIDLDNKEQDALFTKVMFKDKVDLFWELTERGRLIEFYETREKSLDGYLNKASSQQKERFLALKEAEHYPVYPEVAIENFKSYISRVAIAVILSVVLVISPVFLKDRSNRVLELQYATKKGRNVYKTKAAAGMISAFIVMTTLLLIYFGLYSLNRTSMFFKVPLHMFIENYSWYDPTFFQYMILSAVGVYILGFVFALLAMSFSSIMPNFVSLIAIQIPFFIAMIAYGLSYLIVRIISIWVPKWVVPTSYFAMGAISVLFLILMWKREEKRDIVI